MQGHQLTGSADWAPFSILLTVPKESTQVTLGLLLSGAGEIWADDINVLIEPDVKQKSPQPK
jgi:hypothetical protein